MMSMKDSFKLAAIQAASIPFDREASLKKACSLILEAGAMGATIAAFGETWLPGYPFFCNASPSMAGWRAAAEYLSNAVVIGGAETDRLCAAAKRAGTDVVIGIAERDPQSTGTTYCTLLFISGEGAIL
jgi:nitrilase